MATITHTRGDTLPFVLPLPADATAATLQVHAAGACIEIDGTVIRSRAYFAPAAAGILPPGRVYRTTARTTLADGATQTIDSFALLILEGCGDASPAPSGIILSGALVEAGADVASGAGAVSLALSGSLMEAGSDTAAGTGTVTTPTPGSISLSAALIEAGADTASGTASVSVSISAALAGAGADTATGTASVGIKASAALAEAGTGTASGAASVGIAVSAAIAESGADAASSEIVISIPAAWDVTAVDAGILISASPFPQPPLAMAGSGAILIGA